MDTLEVLSEQFFDSKSRELLRELAAAYHVVPHGTGLSIGSFTRPRPEYLQSIRQVCDEIGADYYSEHLCMTRAPGVNMGHLGPLLPSRASVDIVARNVDIVQNELGLPLALENITQPLILPSPDMSEAEFFSEVIDRTGALVLLDITNLYTNCVNQGRDPDAELSHMPLDRVRHVHLAGGRWRDDVLVDSHSHPVPDAVWELLKTVSSITRNFNLIIEHDQNYADPATIVSQVARAREVVLT
ncbi:DUF692 domain-containing protein [Microlunatus elymi]|uniref:DUF692 domain-containing protein n=1 Tax=Microlunatus elymi TaxID=2596828 RepID=UPI00224AC7B9|nr:DUF692 domain-containing protein [Microlunatus elymi]